MLSVRVTTPNVNEDILHWCVFSVLSRMYRAAVRKAVRGITPPTLLTVDGLCFVKEHFVNPHRHVGPSSSACFPVFITYLVGAFTCIV
jgi:hypothetical protein